MSHFLIRPLGIAIIIFLGQSITRDALAAETPIYRAAKDYRDAVRAFERTVLRTPKIHSSVERLVDDLEDSTSRLRSAAADPGRFDRLQMRFVATDKLHTRVEMVFFGDPLLPPDPVLESSWYPVALSYSILERELQYLCQLRSAKRGRLLPVADHRLSIVPLASVEPSFNAGPVDRTQGLGRQPNGYDINGPLVSPLGPQLPYSSNVDRRELTRSLGTGSLGTGGSIQDSTGQYRVPVTRRVITTRDGLRKAVIGAMLQRR